MTELAEFLFKQMGSMILNKKQVSKLIGKSVAFIDAKIHKNEKHLIPEFSKNESGGVEFHIEDVAFFLNFKKQIKNKKVA